jgi:hypothetical protein
MICHVNVEKKWAPLNSFRHRHIMTSTRSDIVMPNLSLLAKDGPTCVEVPSRPESEFAFIWVLPALPAFPALPTPTSCLELGARRGLSVGQSADGEDTWWPWAALGGGVRVLDGSRIRRSSIRCRNLLLELGSSDKLLLFQSSGRVLLGFWNVLNRNG